MEIQTHDIANLFAQLGLPDDPTDIDGFVTAHGPLPGGMPLDEAPFLEPRTGRLPARRAPR